MRARAAKRRTSEAAAPVVGWGATVLVLFFCFCFDLFLFVHFIFIFLVGERGSVCSSSCFVLVWLFLIVFLFGV